MISSKDPEKMLAQKSSAVTMLMVMVLVVFLIQLWLVSIALEEHLAARHHLALPTFLASVFCFLLNLVLLKYLYAIDRR